MLPYLVVGAGIILLVVGAALVSVPLGLVLGGVALVGVGLALDDGKP